MLFEFIGKEKDYFFSLYESEYLSIGLVTVSFYAKIESEKGCFVILSSNNKWHWVGVFETKLFYTKLT